MVVLFLSEKLWISLLLPVKLKRSLVLAENLTTGEQRSVFAGARAVTQETLLSVLFHEVGRTGESRDSLEAEVGGGDVGGKAELAVATRSLYDAAVLDHVAVCEESATCGGQGGGHLEAFSFVDRCNLDLADETALSGSVGTAASANYAVAVGADGTALTGVVDETVVSTVGATADRLLSAGHLPFASTLNSLAGTFESAAFEFEAGGKDVIAGSVGDLSRGCVKAEIVTGGGRVLAATGQALGAHTGGGLIVVVCGAAVAVFTVLDIHAQSVATQGTAKVGIFVVGVFAP